MTVLLECIGTNLEDAQAIEEGGADRIELCSAMALGGLTPGFGTLSLVCNRVGIPVICMVRPREGGMAYSSGEIQAMERDIAAAAGAGAAGVVFGALTPEGKVDVDASSRLLRRARTAGGPGFQTVFHRAFDVTPDPRAALEMLIELGFDRVLTSGQASRAPEGAALIRELVIQAGERIEILPGGGIRSGEVAELVRETGVDQIHLYLTRSGADPSASGNAKVRFGVHPPEDEQALRQVDPGAVRSVKSELAAA